MAIKATLLAFSAFSGLSLAVFQFLQRVQPTPYMDEVFHIPQAQKYCSGRFREWDPKITTLPGLYLISVGVLHPLSRGLERWVCETAHLRMINVGLASLTLIILHRITEQIHGGKHVRTKTRQMRRIRFDRFFKFLILKRIKSNLFKL